MNQFALHFVNFCIYKTQKPMSYILGLRCKLKKCDLFNLAFSGQTDCTVIIFTHCPIWQRGVFKYLVQSLLLVGVT